MNGAMEPGAMGIAHVLSQSSGMGLLPLVLLVLMSLGTCYYLLLKSWVGWQEQRQGRWFLQRFWQSRHLHEVEQQLQQHLPQEAYGRLAAAALAARAQLERRDDSSGLLNLGPADEFVLRALRQAISRERLRLETGLTFLASVGSAAPFVGLFGTVWGIYHALLAIGAAGQSSLDKVAGPVGEALIMTGFGLAVALPAVLIYNLFVRLNRVKLAALDGFAHDLFALLTTGAGVLMTEPSSAHPTGNRATPATELGVI
jgi:biopolymer transport protein ExbB